MDVISVQSISHPRDASDFIKAVFQGTSKAGYQELTLDFHDVSKVFPNACVPICAAIDHYRRNGIVFKMQNASQFLSVTHMTEPLEVSPENLRTAMDPISRVWLISNEQGISMLLDNYVYALSQKTECTSGVIEAFEWCLNEVMDNVLQHSEISRGFVMVQVHPETHRIAICVADAGIGIYNSLLNSIHRPRSVVDAITLAVKEGVTRDTAIGQGNGLWGLLEIVSANSGGLTLTTGPGSVFYRPNSKVQTFDALPFLDRRYQGTIVDFQLRASTPIDLPKALGGHTRVNLTLEQLETERGDHFVEVKEHSHGTGTRKSAEQLRNFVVNIINQGSTRIILDFSGIGVISSSFADELIGKLIVKYGLFVFQQVISLKGMTETVQAILQRSVAQRMMQSLRDSSAGQADNSASR
ncbi:MAG: DUF4325 domain-containing protein [Ignavibacteriae bacterium]|nr:DUF4325 domain-containing protein [Ignavibacteriota bacterium]